MPHQTQPSRRETLWVVLGLFAFLIFNLLTATRYPFVWIDEVMYSDPAFNLLLGHGFTSTAWYAQAADAFWAGNVPMPALLLSAWLKVFGLSIVAVRSLNYLYIVGACVLLWRFSARRNLVATARHRLLLIALILSGYSLIFSYRSGRPDCIGLLVVSAMLYSATDSRHWLALLRLFLLGGTLPWIGLQLLPLLGIGGALLMVFVGQKIVAGVVSSWLGAASGWGALVAFYKWNGVWEAFLQSIGQHTSNSFFSLLLGGSFHHSNLLPKDFSFLPLFVLALLLLFVRWRRREFEFRSPLGFGLVFSVALTAALLVSGKFPTYYGWMTYVPLSLCVCASLSTVTLAGWQRGFTRLLLGTTMLIGAGLHLATAAFDWSDRDPRRVEQLVQHNTSAVDWIYCDYGVFYAAKAHGAQAFVPTYLGSFRPEEKRRVNVLIIHPRQLSEVVEVIGGDWVSTGAELVPVRSGLFGTDWRLGFLAMQNYRFTVYRRAP